MSRTLLLADGSITIQRVVELTFAHEDIRVTSVGDGRRAMQILESEQPDVVLLDVDLPEVNGYALAAHIRRVPRLKNVPVLLLAGAFEPVDQDKAREVASDGVIIKPFEPQVVVTRVKELMDQRERQAAAPPPPTVVPPVTSSVSAGPRQPAEPPAEAAKGREPAFLRVAAREPERVEKVKEDSIPLVESLELPRALWEAPPPPPPAPMPFPPMPVAPPPPPPAPAAQPAPPKVTLASAFTALLAAEQSTQPVPAPVIALSEASVEDAVRRVLVRMTDDLVRRIVLDTAERLIREEIEKIKANPD